MVDAGGVTVMQSTDEQSGRNRDRPIEVIDDEVEASGTYYLKIEEYDCDEKPRWIQLANLWQGTLEHVSSGYEMANPVESANPAMLAVGAASHHDTSTIQGFSGRGPTIDGRLKPDIVGADCGSSAVYGSGPCDFAGTSQASAHVAGLAALVRQVHPDFTATQTADYLRESALPRTAANPLPDPNHTWGHGFAYLPPMGDTARASLSPVPSSIDVGASQTFTLATNVPSPPGVWVGVNYGGANHLSVSGSCPARGNSGVVRADGGKVTVRGCTAGRAEIRIYRYQQLLNTYTVTITVATPSPSHDATLFPVPSSFRVGATRAFTLTTDVPSPPGVWVGVNYRGANRLSVGSCPARGNNGVVLPNDGLVIIRGCYAGTAEIRIYHYRELLRTYTVAVK